MLKGKQAVVPNLSSVRGYQKRSLASDKLSFVASTMPTTEDILLVWSGLAQRPGALACEPPTQYRVFRDAQPHHVPPPPSTKSGAAESTCWMGAMVQRLVVSACQLH